MKKRICISRTEIETLKKADQAKAQQPGGPKKLSEQKLAQAIDLITTLLESRLAKIRNETNRLSLLGGQESKPHVQNGGGLP